VSETEQPYTPQGGEEEERKKRNGIVCLDCHPPPLQ
jgi:hypothetical protein